MIERDNIVSIISNILKDPPIYSLKKEINELRVEKKDVYYEFVENNILNIYLSKSNIKEFFKNRLILHFRRFDYIVDIEENVFENYYKFIVKINLYDKILVDDNFTLILVNGEKRKINKEREQATSKCQVKHFTDINSLTKILSSQSIYAKSLISYTTEKGFSITKESGKKTFVACFYSNKNKSKEMWARFKSKVKPNEKTCLEICMKTNINDLFMDKPLRCYEKVNNQNILNKKKIMQMYGKGDENECVKGIYIDKMIRPVQYIDETTNNVNLEINGGDATIVDYIGRSINKEFAYQKEIRFIYFLRSAVRREMDLINKIELPFNFEQIEKFVVYISNEANEKKYKKLIELKNSYPIPIEIRKIKI